MKSYMKRLKAIEDKREKKTQTNAEAKPVRHGKWMWAKDGYLRCSECTQKAPITPQYQDEPETTDTPYCPWCGAKMDGVET